MTTKTRKTTPRKPTKKKTGKRRAGKKTNFRKWLIPGILFVLLSTSLLATGYFIFLRPGTPLAIPKKAAALSVAPVTHIVEEKTVPLPVITPKDNLALRQTGPSPGNKKGRVTIIIDDMGYRRQTGSRILDLPLNLTFSFLPFGPHTAELAAKADGLQRDILLHLPLEPTDPAWDPGRGTLYLAMSDAEIRENLDKNLADVPMAIGVNNHMGSRFTEDVRAMGILLEELKEKGLFFVDSITTANSVANSLAVTMGVKTARRHVFLDNELDKEKIIRQLTIMVDMAEKHGWAVGIGHPFPTTLEALKDFEGQLRDRVALVGISELVY